MTITDIIKEIRLVLEHLEDIIGIAFIALKLLQNMVQSWWRARKKALNLLPHK